MMAMNVMHDCAQCFLKSILSEISISVKNDCVLMGLTNTSHGSMSMACLQ